MREVLVLRVRMSHGRRRHLHDEVETLGPNGVIRRVHELDGVIARPLHAVEADLDALAFIPGVVLDQVAIQHITQVAVDLFFDLLKLLRVGPPPASTTLPEMGSTSMRSTILGFCTPGSPNSAIICSLVIGSKITVPAMSITRDRLSLPHGSESEALECSTTVPARAHGRRTAMDPHERR